MLKKKNNHTLSSMRQQLFLGWSKHFIQCTNHYATKKHFLWIKFSTLSTITLILFEWDAPLLHQYRKVDFIKCCPSGFTMPTKGQPANQACLWVTQHKKETNTRALMHLPRPSSWDFPVMPEQTRLFLWK